MNLKHKVHNKQISIIMDVLEIKKMHIVKMEDSRFSMEILPRRAVLSKQQELTRRY